MRRWLMLLSLVLLGGAGCHRAYQVIDEPIVGGRANWGQEQVGTAIRKALVARNWLIVKDEPGRLEVSLQKGRASVILEVAYSESAYSIEPLERRHVSVRKMNQWIRKLQKTIRRELAGRFQEGPSSDQDTDED